MLSQIHQHIRHNFFVGVIDGSYFGLGLGLASSVTVLPLFVSTLTDETSLVGLIASIQAIGWQLPQLFTAVRVSRLRRYKPMAVLMSFHERWPFFGLALIAFLLPTLGPRLTLVLTYLLLIWQALGGGFTATAWQSMTGKIMPPNRRGTFWGVQAAGVSLMQAVGALLAGMLLVVLPSPIDFAICFLIAGLSMLISWVALARTREPESEPSNVGETSGMVWRSMFAILQRDKDFRWFLGARILAQITSMALAFYTIYGVRRFAMDEQTAGIMTAVLMLGQMAASPMVGWIGDRWGHRIVFSGGALMMTASAGLALAAPELGWLALAFGLAGFFNAVQWTTIMSLTAEFGTPTERPLYFGLANTLTGPATLLAPLIGGWLADSVGFEATFLVSAVSGILTILVLQYAVRRPIEPVVAPAEHQPI